MSEQKKRSYNSTTRQAQAARTRSRILEVAKNLFQKKGMEYVTIDYIANVAEVSAPTIYALFQSKRGILRVLIDEALPSDLHTKLVETGKKEKNPKDRIMFAAKIARALYDAERMQMETLWGDFVSTPEFKELEKEREQRRYLRQEETIQTLMEEQALLKELSLIQARDILWVLTGRDLYRLFVVDQGWRPEDYEMWLSQMLIKSLIA